MPIDSDRSELNTFIFFLSSNSLLKAKRHSIAYEPGEIAWNRYDSQETIKPKIDEIYDLRAIFPLHKILKLEKEDVFELLELKKHHEELNRLAQS